MDVVVENEIIVELKANENPVKANKVQLINYLSAIKKDIGLLINFGPSGVAVRRKYRNSQIETEYTPFEVDFHSSLSSGKRGKKRLS